MQIDLLKKISHCIEVGKADKDTGFPPELKNEPGAAELTFQALSQGVSPEEILKNGMMTAMQRVGERFSQGQAFIPELLIAARAMKAAMVHLKPYFVSGDAKHKGTVIIGTVKGDLHDIGKNLVGMVLEGDGWEVVDLGVDVSSENFISALERNPESIIAISALLTTTMLNMAELIQDIHKVSDQCRIFVGGAPLSQEFADKIGAERFFPDPYSFSKYLSDAPTHKQE